MELALCKSKTIEQIFDRKNGALIVGTLKKQCRIDIIFPIVLSFLTNGDDVIEYGNCNRDDDDDSSDSSDESEDDDDDGSNGRSEDDDESSDEDNDTVLDDDDL